MSEYLGIENNFVTLIVAVAIGAAVFTAVYNVGRKPKGEVET